MLIAPITFIGHIHKVPEVIRRFFKQVSIMAARALMKQNTVEPFSFCDHLSVVLVKVTIRFPARNNFGRETVAK